MEDKTITTRKKGTVTSLSSMFPTEEAQKAAQRVQEKIAEKQKELDALKGFVSDNNNLINLVQSLPEQLHHDIMVPFGKAAFFPGRLVHTNEFLVLIGEGYYAERTSKQTADILRRRGKALESQVDSLKANMEDLKAEVSFFDATASGAAEGLVEIREDYVEDDTTEKTFKSENKRVVVEDEEYARLMSRMDELEMEELAAESDKQSNEEKQDEIGLDQVSQDNSLDHNLSYGEEYGLRKEPDLLKSERATAEKLLEEKQLQNFTDRSNLEDLKVQSVPKDEFFTCESLPQNGGTAGPPNKTLKPPEASETNRLAPSIGNAVTSSSVEFSQRTQSDALGQKTTKVSAKDSKQAFDSSKAFTGSIVERTDNLQTNREQQNTLQSSGSKPSKPVSRFKAQRR